MTKLSYNPLKALLERAESDATESVAARIVAHYIEHVFSDDLPSCEVFTVFQKILHFSGAVLFLLGAKVSTELYTCQA